MNKSPIHLEYATTQCIIKLCICYEILLIIVIKKNYLLLLLIWIKRKLLIGLIGIFCLILWMLFVFTQILWIWFVFYILTLNRKFQLTISFLIPFSWQVLFDGAAVCLPCCMSLSLNLLYVKSTVTRILVVLCSLW